MIGSFLSTTLNIVTLPLNAANATIDLITDGDGSKESRMKPSDCPNPVRGAERLRDVIADELKSLDKQ